MKLSCYCAMATLTLSLTTFGQQEKNKLRTLAAPAYFIKAEQFDAMPEAQRLTYTSVCVSDFLG